MKKLFLMLSIAGTVMFAAAQGTTPATPATPTQAPTPAPDPNAPEIKWDATTIDYGTVTKGDENNSTRVFKFTNVGKSPLIISDTRGSCGCTVPTKPTEPILPGKTGEIKVHYDINRVGQFTKTVTVTSNAKNANETLKIQGTVVDPAAAQPNTNPVSPAPTTPTSPTTPH